MLPVIWRQTAREDLAHLLRHIAQKGPHAARRLRRACEMIFCCVRFKHSVSKSLSFRMRFENYASSLLRGNLSLIQSQTN